MSKFVVNHITSLTNKNIIPSTKVKVGEIYRLKCTYKTAPESAYSIAQAWDLHSALYFEVLEISKHSDRIMQGEVYYQTSEGTYKKVPRVLDHFAYCICYSGDVLLKPTTPKDKEAIRLIKLL